MVPVEVSGKTFQNFATHTLKPSKPWIGHLSEPGSSSAFEIL